MMLAHDSAREVLDAAPYAIAIVNARGRIEYVNSAAEAMFLIGTNELTGRSFDTVLPQRFRSRERKFLNRYCSRRRQRAKRITLELTMSRQNGVEFPAAVSLSRVATSSEVLAACMIRDVTRQRAFERQLLEARDLAEKENRAKSLFLAAASHDLRQPLQTLSLLDEILARTVQTGSQAATALASQSEALRMMTDLLNSLLDISRLEAGVIKPDVTDVSVSRIFRRLRAEFSALAEAKGLALTVEDSDAVVRSDPVLLSQVIQNLIGNAIRYTGRGRVDVRCLARTDTVRIDVLDTGIGIPADQIESIFSEFYRAGERRGVNSSDGVGLGLAIARRTAEILGCSLEVASTVGKGSRFRLNVPRARTQARDDPDDDSGKILTLPRDAVVVVIDDDQAVVDATALLLGALHLNCITARSSAAALEAIANRGESPDLLICDYHLSSHETGVDAICAVRDRYGPALPVILTTGDTSERLTATAGVIEACHLLKKPVAADEFLCLTSKLLAENVA